MNRTPEQRIAADLGLTTADLERIVRDERARKLGPKLAREVREMLKHTPAPKGIRSDFAHHNYRASVSKILHEIDRPTNPPLVKLGPGGDFVREIGGGQ